MHLLSYKQGFVNRQIWPIQTLTKPFVVETDSSSFAIGAILSQRDDNGKVHPILFASRAMNTAEQYYIDSEKEVCVVVLSLKKFRNYLLTARKFTLTTDHEVLRFSFEKKDVHGHFVRCADLTAESCFDIVYCNCKASLPRGLFIKTIFEF